MLNSGIIALLGAGLAAFLAVNFGSPNGLPLADAAIQRSTTTHLSRSAPTTISAQLIQQQYKAKAAAHVILPSPSASPSALAPATAIPTTAPTKTASTPTASYTTASPTSTPTPTPTYAAASVTQATASSKDLGSELLAKAETQGGTPYVYGGDAPGGFDCSGLIYWAAQQLGITGMPRDTYEMLSTGVASGLLVTTNDPQPGDLAFFGPGHVELVTSRVDYTWGAQQSGSVVGYNRYWPGSYAPTEYLRVT